MLIKFRSSRLLAIAVLCLFWCACAGCGSKPSVVPVHGTVLLNDKPLASGALVTLPQSGRGAHGTITDGEFYLSTFGNNDGAVPGTHKVAVIAQEKSQGTGPEAPAGKLLVPEQYTNPDTSKLTIEVKSGETNSPTLKLISP